MSDPMRELFGPVIHRYTRADAIRDEVLRDVSEVAREAGFTVPVALTSAVWFDCVSWTDEDEARKPEFTGQDEAGRLWDVLTVLFHTIRRKRAAAPSDDPSRLGFQVLRIPREGRGLRPRLATLVAHVGPGDHAEPVMTVLMPDED
jgi:hypothetical protein